jgi:hypothetical protein
VDTKELETLDPLHYSPINVNGGLFSIPFPLVHDHLLCVAHIEGEVVVLAPHYQVSDLLPIGSLSVIRPTTVVLSANLMIVLESCHTVVGEQGVQEGTKHAPLRGPGVENQSGRCVAAYPYHLGAAHQEVQDPVAEEGV